MSKIDCIGELNICIKQGADIRMCGTIRDNNGSPLDITGWQMFFRGKYDINDVDLIIDAKTGDTDSSKIVILDQITNQGKFEIIVEGSETVLFDPKRTITHDFKFITDGNEKDYFFDGTLVTTKAV